MTPDVYLQTVINRHSISTLSIKATVEKLVPQIKLWAGDHLLDLRYSGSHAKGTAVKGGTDVDLFISLSSNFRPRLKETYFSLHDHFLDFSPIKQNVSIGLICYGMKVDLVPAHRQNNLGYDHSIYLSRQDTWMKTNIDKHITTVSTSGRLQEIKILKIWRNQKGLDFPSFYLELVVLNALENCKSSSISNNVLRVLEFLRKEFLSKKYIDPANSNNTISDDLNETEKLAIAIQAHNDLKKLHWNSIVY
jgi:hypothetical protein